MNYYERYYVEGLESEENSSALMRILMNYCDSFSLVYFRYRENEKQKRETVRIKKILSKYKINSKSVMEWPGTKQITNHMGHIYNLVTYRIESDMSNVLPFMDEVGSMWNWDYPDYPMDPCFYKNGLAMFFLTCHEKLSTIYLRKNEGYPTISELESIGLNLIFEGTVPESKIYSQNDGINYFE